MPTPEEMDWLSAKYPEHLRQVLPSALRVLATSRQSKGKRFYNNDLPMLCQVCQIPMMFTEPGDPTQICYPRDRSTRARSIHFCSDHCKEIFEHEPEKYIQAWLPVHQISRATAFPEGVDPTRAGLQSVPNVLEYWQLDQAATTGDFKGSRGPEELRRLARAGHQELRRTTAMTTLPSPRPPTSSSRATRWTIPRQPAALRRLGPAPDVLCAVLLAAAAGHAVRRHGRTSTARCLRLSPGLRSRSIGTRSIWLKSGTALHAGLRTRAWRKTVSGTRT